MIEIKDLLVKKENTIKDVMRVIDNSGLGIAFVVNEENKLEGTITDGDIRKALGKGTDINSKAMEIMNASPLSINEGTTKDKIVDMIDLRPKGFSKFYSMKIPVIDSDGKITNVAVYYFKDNSLNFINDKGYEHREHIKKILIVGGAGFLGSILARKLLAKGYSVRVLDIMLFGEKPIEELKDNENFELIEGDIRDITTLTKSLQGVDAVIHLAAIVGDPATKNQPEDAIETNYLATFTLAQACKYHQINRFIFASTCSVYGIGGDKIDESSELNPVSLYARSKIESENCILNLVDENFSPTIMRMATLYGVSPRMRFDLVVNIFGMLSTKEKKISVFGGEQWRPLLNVDDAAEAYIKCLEAPISKVRGEVFNVGSNAQNYQIKQIANMVKEQFPETEVVYTDKEVVDGKMDKRDYKVSFDKIENTLGFNVNFDIKRSLQDIADMIKEGKIKDVKDPIYYNHKIEGVRK